MLVYLTNNEEKSASDGVGNGIEEWKSSMVNTHPLTLSNSRAMSNTDPFGKWWRFEVNKEAHSTTFKVLAPWGVIAVNSNHSAPLFGLRVRQWP